MQLTTPIVLKDDNGHEHSVTATVQGLPEFSPNKFLDHLAHKLEEAARRYTEKA